MSTPIRKQPGSALDRIAELLLEALPPGDVEADDAPTATDASLVDAHDPPEAA